MLPVTPRPQEAIGRLRFKRRRCNIVCSFVSVRVVVLRIELSTTRLSAVSGPPALDYHAKSGTPESNRNPPAPKAGVLPSAPLPVCFQSERPRPIRHPCRSVPEPAISRSPGPQAGTLARYQASPRSVVSGSCGSRTRLNALKGRHPQTDRRTSRVGTRQSRSGSGGARILVSGSSDRRYTVSATDPNKKSPASFVTPGFGKLDRMAGPSVTIADAAWAGYSPDNRQTARRSVVRE